MIVTVLEQRVFKNTGKRFEEDFKSSFGPHIWTYRPKDTGGGQLARFTNESLCDLMAYDIQSKNFILFELKSTLGTSVSVRPYDQCMQYEKEQIDFDNWNSGMTPEEKKPLKEKIVRERKRVKELYKATNQAMIKYHQIKSLIEIYEEFQIETYIAFTFFKSVATYVVPVHFFIDSFWKTTTKKSINEDDLDSLVEAGQAYRLEQEYIGRSMRSKYVLDFLIENVK